MYSDGVTEAVSPEGEEFGEERVTRLVAENRRRSPAAHIAEEVTAALAAWTGGKPPTDDFHAEGRSRQRTASGKGMAGGAMLGPGHGLS